MNIRLLCRVFIRVIFSVVFAGIFYTAWMAVAIPVIRSENAGAVLRTIIWLAAPIVTAAGFATGIVIFELFPGTGEKSKAPRLYRRGIFTCSGETRRSLPSPKRYVQAGIPSFAVGYGGLPFSHSSTGFHPWLYAKAGKFLNIFKWSLIGCAIGAGSVVWFGPMLIVFGMFLVGTASIALREISMLRRGKRNISCDS